jgi:release factor glutamine methyltransferase
MTATVKEIKNKTEQYFVSKNIPNAKLDTDLILAHCLEIKRLDLYLELERPIFEQQLDKIRECVRRRGKREPLQYILGFTEFFNLTLKVDSRALIPRQETEYMIDLCLSVVEDASRVLDLGTGSGIIALALATALPNSEVWAVDQNEGALDLAKENAKLLGLERRVDFLVSDWLAQVPQEPLFNLIVANPPYLSEAELDCAEPEVKEYEPRDALVSKEEGLCDLKRIIDAAHLFLSPEGWLVLETGITQHEALSEVARKIGYRTIESKRDLQNQPRFLFMQR